MYCVKCGRQAGPGDQYCPGCGALVGGGPRPQPRLARHLRLVGIFWIVLSAIHLLSALKLVFVSQVVLNVVRTHISIPHFVGPLVSLVGLGLAVAGVAGLAAGWGLLQRAPWARILAIVLAILSLPAIPFGTALGIYTLWVLLASGAAEEYDRFTTPA
jgi:hypothetical protein